MQAIVKTLTRPIATTSNTPGIAPMVATPVGSARKACEKLKAIVRKNVSQNGGSASTRADSALHARRSRSTARTRGA